MEVSAVLPGFIFPWTNAHWARAWYIARWAWSSRVRWTQRLAALAHL